MKRLNFFAAAVLALFAVACNPEPDVPDSLTTEAADITFPGIGGEEAVTFTVNTDWMITADKTWVEFDAETGAAGDITVLLSVGQNTEETSRTAVVTIVAGTEVKEFSVSQNGYVKTKETFDVFNKEQVFTYTVASELIGVTVSDDAKGWIVEKKSDKENVLEFTIHENKDGGERTGTVTINTEDSEHVVVINQIEVMAMTSAEVVFLGTKMMPYDSDNGYPEFDEYFVALTGNGASVNLAVNAADAARVELPEGKFVLDASGKHAVGTFSVNADEQYYTSLSENGQEKEVIEGEVTISRNGEEYTIVATLYDVAQVAYKYSYEGKIGNITKDDLGTYFYGASFYGAYNTYFASKANEWNLNIIASAAAEGQAYFQWFVMDFYTEAGEVADVTFPVGTFTFGEPKEDETVKYANGNINASPNTFCGYAQNPGKTEQYSFTGGTVTVSKDEAGRVVLSFENVTYDIYTKSDPEDYWGDFDVKGSSGSYSAVLPGVAVTDITANSAYYPDGSFDLSGQIGQYSGLYYGQNITIATVPYEMDNIFMMWFANVLWNYTVQFYINTKEEWEFVPNYPTSRPRYCTTPIPDATYNFVTGENPNGNAKGNNVILSTGQCYVENSYTGTKAFITGGSISMGATSVTLDIECGKVQYPGDATATVLDTPFKFTGVVTSGMWLFQDKRPK